ncbi:GIY-YIG nuclease family protein [Vibrio porteresiae]|uniref:GIY-YIG nuclease family protein n=1 Tax=Vibrio porteresiae DSM 19223 TaxID=1123496 RepID=A0ABZ0QHV6_9VIBR|nr:GIY-YIG nuclease family protein [Vibrio porteresiae]WPC75292.1 GIY-YIG nuclease family protein [Vibrio porteresiae DSM 19223]
MAFKASHSKACCKVNKPSEVLYVGSSTTGIKKRLTQHLVDCADQTYALHLYAWFKGKYKVDVLEYDEPNEVIQLIEDNISNKLKPAFGKQGGNNK